MTNEQVSCLEQRKKQGVDCIKWINNYKKMNIMEYGYEKRDHRGNLVYPMHPVQEEDADNVIAAFIVGNGYVPVSPVTYESAEECRKACDVHNGYHGWTKGEVDAIFFKSMTEQYPEETKE